MRQKSFLAPIFIVDGKAPTFKWFLRCPQGCRIGPCDGFGQEPHHHICLLRRNKMLFLQTQEIGFQQGIDDGSTSSEADIMWELLEERREQAGVSTIEEMALRIIRTAMGLPPEYNVVDIKDVEYKNKPRLHVVK